MRKILIFTIDLYKKFISPIINPVPRCRFYPSCSRYAKDAVMKYGVFKGSALAIWRVLRCNPFNPGGYDPVK